jgi:hypothetical protein
MKDPVLDEPVIVLTAARSGSTLLRLILDAHPDLACPPETNIVRICAQLAAVWCMTNGESSADDIPEGLREAIAKAISSVFHEPLRRQGKARWCDKSLGTAPLAAWFSKLYPETKFICLYRHCADFIYSGLEASPWGLTSYGFEQFSGMRSGNNVSALASYWIEHTGRILEFEQKNRDRCLRMHYEQIVRAPEETARQIFSFIGVEHVPGITVTCFGRSSEDLGPGDHKIRATYKITADSVGRGIRIPVNMIPAPQRQVMNHLLTQLEYTPLDEAWRRSPGPPALLKGSASDPGESVQLSGSIGDRLVRSFLDNIGSVFCTRVNASFQRSLPTIDMTETGGGHTFGLVAYNVDEHRLLRTWRVDLKARTITPTDALGADIPDANWLVSADVETWLRVLSGRANMSACVRSGEIRYIGLCEKDQLDGQAGEDELLQNSRTDDRMLIVRQLLGLVGYPEEVST